MSAERERPLFKTDIKDWQIADGSDEHLTEPQRKSWPVRLLPNAYGGLRVGFTDPDGIEREFNFEIKDGNLQVAMSFDALGDPLAVATIVGETIHVAPFTDNGNHPGAAIVGKDSIKVVPEYEPPASYTEEGPAPKP